MYAGTSFPLTFRFHTSISSFLISSCGQYLSIIFFLSTSQVIEYALGPKVLICPFHQVKAAPNRLSFAALDVLATRPACHSFLASYLSSLRESLPSVPGAYGRTLEALPSQPAASGNKSRIPGAMSRVHTHDHDGSEAPDRSHESILSSEPKHLEKHRPPPS
ncbi:hypothetical protein Tco_1085329 [Tanacetum coccineum]